MTEDTPSSVPGTGRDETPTGVLVVDKPTGLTSHDVVDQARRALGERGIGHSGTLDPLATGVLVLLVGRARRIQELLMKRRKEYHAVVVLGATSHTDDAEGPIEVTPGARYPSQEEVESALLEFTGTIQQRPPAFSSVHSGGQRAWQRARRGESVELPERSVLVEELELLEFEPQRLSLRVRAGKGFYVRSLARDLGERLTVGGYLGGLRRTRCGGFALADAIDLADLSPESVLPLARALATEARVDLASDQFEALVSGAFVPCEIVDGPGAAEADPAHCPLFAWIAGRPVARVRAVPGGVRSRGLLL